MNTSIDACITFDTTGSMYPCLTQVRRNVTETVKRLFKDIPDLRIAIIAHGDYCDARSAYVTKIMDFSTDVNEVSRFVNNVERTFGGDTPECYELVLHEARTELTWQSGRSKIVVMIGDDVPHGPNHHENTKKIDWRNELGLLMEAGINVYGVHAMPGIRRHSKPFYTEIAEKTGGFYLTLDQFNYVTDLLMSICYKQDSDEALNQYANEIEKGNRMTRGLAMSIGALRGEEVSYESYGTSPRPDVVARTKYAFEEDGLNPVPSGRFQTIEVFEDVKIREFIEEQGIDFKTGRGFYELVRYGKKRYKVQPHKEIIMMDRESGDFFNGSECREMLGLVEWRPKSECKGADAEYLSPKAIDKYRVFIQSTSYTRKLVPGSSLLYEVEDWEHAEAA